MRDASKEVQRSQKNELVGEFGEVESQRVMSQAPEGTMIVISYLGTRSQYPTVA